jgi:phosphoglycolate phosphatase
LVKAVLFDLDGTLADTALDLGEAINRLLEKQGKSRLGMDEIRPIASSGANGLLKKALNIGTEHPEHKMWRQAYLAEYEACFTDNTVLFDDVNALLDQLVAQNLPWGIVTNKPERFTTPLLPRLGFLHEPQVVVSCGGTAHAKPHTKPMFDACLALGVAASDCVYVGDAECDMVAGKNAGMKTVLVNWGYLHAADDLSQWPIDARIDTPLDLLHVLKSFCR